MALVLVQRRPLQVVALPGFDPSLARSRNGDAVAVGDVDAFSDIDLDGGVPGVRLLLTFECLDVALAGRIDVVDDPSLPIYTFFLPRAFATRHAAPLLAR